MRLELLFEELQRGELPVAGRYGLFQLGEVLLETAYLPQQLFLYSIGLNLLIVHGQLYVLYLLSELLPVPVLLVPHFLDLPTEFPHFFFESFNFLLLFLNSVILLCQTIMKFSGYPFDFHQNLPD